MDYSLLVNLTIILFGGTLGGIIATKLKQPIIVGYIASGLLLGSLIPHIRDEPELITLIAEIGVSLLLFTLGLEFSLNRLKGVGKPGVLGAIMQILSVIIIFTVFLPFVMDIKFNVALFIGGVFALSSTAVVAKILTDKGELDSSHGDLIMAWLIIQDIAIVPLTLILPQIASDTGFELLPLLLNTAKSLVAIYLLLILGKKTVPFIFKRLALSDNRELLLVSAFMFCIAVSLLGSFLGLPFAVGAFLAGLLLSTSAVNHEVFTEIRPLKDLFSSVFFVSLGFLTSLGVLYQYFFIALSLAFLVMFIKVLIILILVIFFNYHSKLAFLTAVALFQIGEFSFILAKVGLDANILSAEIFQIVIASSIITILMTPIAYNLAPITYKRFRTFVKSYIPKLYELIFNLADSDAKMPRPRKSKLKDHMILIGYGRVGSYIGKVLSSTTISYVVIDLHFRTIQELRKRGVFSIYGDAINRDILKLANISHAKGIVIAVPDIVSSELILNNVRSMNPSAEIIMRSHRLEDIAKLSIRGVKHIIEPEFEAAVEMVARVFRSSGLSNKTEVEIITKTRKERKF